MPETKTKIKPIKINKANVKRLHNAIALYCVELGLSSSETLSFAKASVKRMTWQSIAGVKAAITKGQEINLIPSD